MRARKQCSENWTRMLWVVVILGLPKKHGHNQAPDNPIAFLRRQHLGTSSFRSIERVLRWRKLW